MAFADTTLLNVKTVNEAMDTIANSTDTLVSVVASNCPTCQNKVVWLIENKEASTVLGMPEGLASIVIPSVISIGIFGLGLLANWLFKKYERARVLKTDRFVITKWVTLMKSPVMAQVSHCRKFAQNARENRQLFPVSLGVSRLLAHKLSDMDIIKLVEVFVNATEGYSEQKSKDLFNVVSQLEYLEKIDKKLTEDYMIYYEYSHELAKQWNTLYQRFEVLRGLIFAEVNGDRTHPLCDFMIDLNALNNEWAAKFPNGANICDTKENMLDIALPMASEIVNKLPSLQLVHDINHNLVAMRNIHTQWLAHNQGNARLFYDTAIRIVSVYKTLNKASENLQELKMKPFWRIS